METCSEYAQPAWDKGSTNCCLCLVVTRSLAPRLTSHYSTCLPGEERNNYTIVFVINLTNLQNTVCKYSQQFSGNEQHDSQEFLNTLLDGLHEDLNRILKKPPVQMTPEREAELERLPQQIASQQEWSVYRMRDDSIVVDFFQGQFRNRMECLTCRKTSTTYNSFMYLSMPLPQTRGRATLQQCLDMFVQEEVMEKADAWFVTVSNSSGHLS